MLSNRVAWIDVIAVTSQLKSSGLGREALDDFCGRMASQGVPLVMTHLYLPGFFLRHGFRWTSAGERWSRRCDAAGGGVPAVLSSFEQQPA